MISIIRIYCLFSTFLFFTNLTAQSVDQFFIKISPNQELVNCGKLIVQKSKTIKKFYVKDAKVDIHHPESIIDWLNDSIKRDSVNDGKILFYIHGFWGSIPYSLNRTTQEFKNTYFNYNDTKVSAVVHILWNANDVYYKKCIYNLENSTRILASIFNHIESNLKFEYSLMCHSMGNRFLHKCLTTQKVKINFQELILMAPDLDYRKFEEEPSVFSSISASTVIFFHTKDQTLKMSKGLNKVERLGRLNKSDISENIKFIDCTDLKDIKSMHDSLMKHLYFLTSETVKRQVEEILEK